jgi:hypothetical protein
MPVNSLTSCQPIARQKRHIYCTGLKMPVNSLTSCQPIFRQKRCITTCYKIQEITLKMPVNSLTTCQKIVWQKRRIYCTGNMLQNACE